MGLSYLFILSFVLCLTSCPPGVSALLLSASDLLPIDVVIQQTRECFPELWGHPILEVAIWSRGLEI